VPDGSVRIFSSLNANAEEVIFKNMHRSTVTAIAVTEDGDKLITGGDDSMIAVWRLSALGHVESALETGFISNRSISTSIELIGFLHGHIETISTLKVSSKFNLILSASKDLTIIAWDLNRLSCSFCLTGFSSPIVDIAICEATGDIAACTKSDIFLWDLNGVFIARHSVNASSIYSLAIASPVGHLVNFSNLIFSGHEDGSINIWEVVNILKPDVKLSSTSSRLYASSLISKHIWETQSCKWSFSLKKTIETLHKMPVRVLYIPSDKSGLWSGDWGGHAYFWSLSVEDFAEESAAAASSNLKLSIDEVREMQCGSCAKRGWKKNENRYNCKTCVKVFCEFCYMDHLRSHQPTSPLFWLPHLSSTT
jgi:WD40 repeat protein